MRNVLVISVKALRQMAKDCLRYESIETGGVLVGTRVVGQTIVPFVVLAGEGASRSAAGFAPDSEFQQKFLDFLAERFPGLDYVGDYHRHPGSMDHPSLHDLVTARDIVTDENWNKVVACFPILTVQGGRVRMKSYFIARGDQTFSEMAVEVVEDTDPRIVAALTGVVPIRPLEEVEHDRELVSPCRCRGGRLHRRLPQLWRRLRHREAK